MENERGQSTCRAARQAWQLGQPLCSRLFPLPEVLSSPPRRGLSISPLLPFPFVQSAVLFTFLQCGSAAPFSFSSLQSSYVAIIKKKSCGRCQETVVDADSRQRFSWKVLVEPGNVNRQKRVLNPRYCLIMAHRRRTWRLCSKHSFPKTSRSRRSYRSYMGGDKSAYSGLTCRVRSAQAHMFLLHHPRAAG